MVFKNEYRMTRKRYVKWATPVFWKLPVFYILMVLLVFGIFCWWYFAKHNVEQRWETLAAFIVLITLYRGFLYRPLAADKQFRITRQKKYNDEDWDVAIIVNDKGIKYKTNNRVESYVKWDDIVAFKEATSFYDLVDTLGQQARLDKECFTEGDAESFKLYMETQHPDIPYSVVEPKGNR